MSQLELDAQFVKLGYWGNLSQGRVMGQTFTTDSKTGAVLIALLAVISSLGMTHLWHLLTFAYHLARANGRPADGLFRHQQTLFRTLPTPSSMVADSIKLWLVWRGISDRALVRSVMHLSIALVFAMASLTVSIFSSYVASNSNVEVLIQSPHCGSFNWESSWNSYMAVNNAAASQYASTCYRPGMLPNQCNVFHRPNIPFTSEIVQCPFEGKMCASPALSLDSGLIDLNDAFGMNLEEADRIRYRRKSTCAVLTLDGYTRVVNVSSGYDATLGRETFLGEQMVEYLYGKSTNSEDYLSQSLFQANLSSSYGQTSTTDYQFMASDFRVIPELDRKDADVSLKLVTKNSLKYLRPVDDPLFSAHRAQNVTMQGGGMIQYLSDFPGSIIGCVQQYQYCTSKQFCTELAGVPEDVSRIFPGASKSQMAMLELLRDAAMIQDVVSVTGYEAAQLIQQDLVAEALPHDQWIKELKFWEANVWASYQITMVDYAIGPAVRVPLAESYVIPRANETKKVCQIQKMRKPGGFVNINFFGFLFTVIASGTIVLTDLVLLRSLLYLRKYKTRLSPRLDRWLQDGIYQLQRRAQEAQNNGVWIKLTEEVPITSVKTSLPELLIDTLPVSGKPLSQTETVQGESGSSVSGSLPQEQQGDEPQGDQQQEEKSHLHTNGPVSEPATPDSSSVGRGSGLSTQSQPDSSMDGRTSSEPAVTSESRAD